MNGILNDLRYAFRTFRKEPAFTFVAVLTLALGIGANTAIFSVVNGVLLKPLSYRDPGSLAVIYTDLPKIGLFKIWSSGLEILDYREQTHLFEQVAYVRGGGGLTMTGRGDAEQIEAMFLSWDVLPLLGMTPALGRLLAEEEDVPNGPRAVMLSYEFWERRFGADRIRAGLPHSRRCVLQIATESTETTDPCHPSRNNVSYPPPIRDSSKWGWEGNISPGLGGVSVDSVAITIPEQGTTSALSQSFSDISGSTEAARLAGRKVADTAAIGNSAAPYVLGCRRIQRSK